MSPRMICYLSEKPRRQSDSQTLLWESGQQENEDMRNKRIGSEKGSIACLAVGCLIALALVGCATQRVPAAAPAAQMTFASAEAAKNALIAAVQERNPGKVEAIFGPDSKELVQSGDEVADRATRDRFLQAVGEKAELVPASEDIVILHIGKEDWPFPIPIVKDETGWRFDTPAGKEELLNRRIGRNELFTIEFCRVYVQAQNEYASKDRSGDGVKEFAEKFLSSEGKRDGLYWKAAEGEEESPLGPLAAAAIQEGYGPKPPNPTGQSQPFHGYFFKILTAQGDNAPGGAKTYIVNRHMTGGFALVAYPVQYGSTGIMTFMVNQQGIVFQKDLGEKTVEAIKDVTQYDPNDSWQPVGD